MKAKILKYLSYFQSLMSHIAGVFFLQFILSANQVEKNAPLWTKASVLVSLSKNQFEWHLT